MCENCETEAYHLPAEHISATDIIVVGLRLVGNILGTAGAAVHALANLGASHDLWSRRREEWAAQVGREIEMLTGPDS